MPDYRPAALYMLFVMLFVMLFIANCPIHCRADDIPRRALPELPAPPKTELEPGKLMVVGGVRGQWWPLPTAFVLAQTYAESHELEALMLRSEELVDVLQLQSRAKDKQITQLAQLAELSEERALKTELALKAADVGRAQAEEETKNVRAQANAWHRSPLLWCALGAVVGGVTVGLVLRDR